MPTAKKTTAPASEAPVVGKQAPAAPAEAPVEEESLSVKERKAAFQRIIDAYKVSNPVKYELKKDELAKKLAAIK